MSTRATRWIWTVPGTNYGVHIYWDVVDRRTYIEIGPSYSKFTVEWPRVWKNRWSQK